MRASRIGKGLLTVLGLCLALYPIAGCAQKTETPAGLALGATAPDFTLKDCNGNSHTLKQYLDKVVVLEMCSIECPWSRGADPYLVELAAKYAPDNVVFLGIDSHNSVTVEQIKEYAEKNGKTYPVLKDVDNKYADLLGAKTTPEVFVIDKKGKLAYHGAVDDREEEATKGKTPYLDNAIAAVLAGKSADPAETRSWGCSIKRK